MKGIDKNSKGYYQAKNFFKGGVFFKEMGNVCGVLIAKKRNKSNWNIPLAIQQLNKELEQFISTL